MRIDPPETGPELDQLTAYLDLQRATMLRKTEGLTREQLAQPHPPSTLTLGGLLNHLALVEDSWFRVRFAGPAGRRAVGRHRLGRRPRLRVPHRRRARARGAAPPVRAGLRRAAGRSWPPPRAWTSSRSQQRRNGTHFDLRWMLLHLIEETARHAGHADLLREAIDGATGE